MPHQGQGHLEVAQAPELQTHYCPDCGMPAWVEWAEPGASTGATVLVKVRCFQRHWFLLPSDYLVRPPTGSSPEH